MGNINNTIARLEFAQIGWVVPDIQAAVQFLSNTLGILRHLSNTGCCYRDHGHYTGRMESYQTNGTGWFKVKSLFVLFCQIFKTRLFAPNACQAVSKKCILVYRFSAL